MKTFLVSTLLLFSISSVFADKYYSITDGPWSSNTTWSHTKNGPAATTSPNPQDEVIIRHRVVHNTGSTYSHHGNVTIKASGEYRINTGYGSSNYYLFRGSLFDIYGKLWTSSDFHHQQNGTSDSGQLNLQEGSVVEIGDDLILNANSRTIMNTVDCGSARVVDDIYFVGTSSQMCGQGHFIVPDKLRAWNDASAEVFPAVSQFQSQLCDGFVLYANTGDCQNDDPIVTGTGPFDLPVEYLSLDVYWEAETVAIEWQTANELQNDFFTVERSIDGKSFDPITNVEGAGTTDQVSSYKVNDFRPYSGKAFYRIKQTDFDGTSSFSNVIEIEFNQLSPNLVLYPNPVVSDHIMLSGLPRESVFEIKILNIKGAVVKQFISTASMEPERKIELPTNLQSGLYFLSVSAEDFLFTQKIQVQ
ncbi:MAG: T9SS type A sorting domain-containing protein [Bacteroidota bacterium]